MALPAGELVMVYTAPAERARRDGRDGDAAAAGAAASSTPPMPATMAALVLNLRMKLSLSDECGRRRQAPILRVRTKPDRYIGRRKGRKRPADGREPRRRPSTCVPHNSVA